MHAWAQVWRSEFGLAKPWYFLFQPSYWRAACNWKEVGTGSLHFTGERVHTHEEGDGVEMTGSGGTSVTGQVRVAAEEEVKGAEKVPVEEVAGHMRQQIEDQECVHLSGLKKVHVNLPSIAQARSFTRIHMFLCFCRFLIPTLGQRSLWTGWT